MVKVCNSAALPKRGGFLMEVALSVAIGPGQRCHLLLALPPGLSLRDGKGAVAMALTHPKGFKAADGHHVRPMLKPSRNEHGAYRSMDQNRSAVTLCVTIVNCTPDKTVTFVRGSAYAYVRFSDFERVGPPCRLVLAGWDSSSRPLEYAEGSTGTKRRRQQMNNCRAGETSTPSPRAPPAPRALRAAQQDDIPDLEPQRLFPWDGIHSLHPPMEPPALLRFRCSPPGGASQSQPSFLTARPLPSTIQQSCPWVGRLVVMLASRLVAPLEGDAVTAPDLPFELVEGHLCLGSTL